MLHNTLIPYCLRIFFKIKLSKIIVFQHLDKFNSEIWFSFKFSSFITIHSSFIIHFPLASFFESIFTLKCRQIVIITSYWRHHYVIMMSSWSRSEKIPSSSLQLYFQVLLKAWNFQSRLCTWIHYHFHVPSIHDSWMFLTRDSRTDRFGRTHLTLSTQYEPCKWGVVISLWISVPNERIYFPLN